MKNESIFFSGHSKQSYFKRMAETTHDCRRPIYRKVFRGQKNVIKNINKKYIYTKVENLIQIQNLKCFYLTTDFDAKMIRNKIFHMKLYTIEYFSRSFK